MADFYFAEGLAEILALYQGPDSPTVKYPGKEGEKGPQVVRLLCACGFGTSSQDLSMAVAPQGEEMDTSEAKCPHCSDDLMTPEEFAAYALKDSEEKAKKLADAAEGKES